MQDAANVAGGLSYRGGRRGRRRLARTFSLARWGEYRAILEHAVACDYAILSLEEWVLDGPRDERPTLILRHDVDQDPRAVRPMLAAERDLGVASTWYFRWRTADPRIVAEVRDAGHAVGLHYETLTRRALEARRSDAQDVDEVEAAREELREEIAAFQERFGPIRSVSAHGDSRVPGVSNQVLLRGQDASDFGVECDGNEGLGGRGLAVWLTDRSTPDGRWKDRMEPLKLLTERASPMLLLTHPNNLASGLGLWADRFLAAALRTPVPGSRRTPIRTGGDAPADPAAVPRASAFAPIAAALERGVREYYESRGEPLSGISGQNTLLTNSHLAERRADTLLEVLAARGGTTDLAGLRLLDVGCGFGALSVLFASRGAEVTAVDPNGERFEVGERIARERSLPVTFRRGWMEETAFGTDGFDLVVLNNSFCYVVPREDRRIALGNLRAALRPGGWLLMRNPNRLFPVDQFTGLPFVSMLPPGAAQRCLRVLRRHRSHVRLVSTRGIRHELTRAGFVEAGTASPRRDAVSRLLVPLARYQHAVARRPAEDER